MAIPNQSKGFCTIFCLFLCVPFVLGMCVYEHKHVSLSKATISNPEKNCMLHLYFQPFTSAGVLISFRTSTVSSKNMLQ